MKAKTTRRILALILSVVMILTLIPAVFAADFPDVPDGSWFKPFVDYCVDFGLMGDTGNGTFNPNGTVTREQAVQTLYAMASKPAVTYKPDFSDVKDGQWYTDAIMWAVENGITSGTGNGKFGVGVAVTREQIATFFYKYSIYAGMEEDFASINKFPDAGKVSSWAKAAVQWAVKYGVLSGKDIGGTAYLKPQDPLSRAELAAMLSSFHKIVPPPCDHECVLTGAKEATCTEDGYTGDMICSKCGFVQSKGSVIPALGHEYGDDGFCIRCGEPNPNMQRVFTLADELPIGKKVIIYNPGHQMVIKNENDNDWYLIPENLVPTGDQFIEENEGDLDPYIWTIVDNGDGTVSFVNGENAIAAWVSGTYIELTNNANYPDSDKSWVVTAAGEDNLFTIGSKTLSNSYGPAYIECFYNANKDQTKISGYTSSNPTSKLGDFGFQFYSFGKPCQHNYVAGKVTAPTCTEEGYTLYTCSKCGASQKGDIVAALGHIDADNNSECDRCGAPMGNFQKVTDGVLANGMEIVIYNPGHGMAVSNETDNNWYLVPVVIAPNGDVIESPDENLIWTVIDNGDGTYSFKSGDYMIGAWVSGTYIELTNDPDYAGVDTKWVVTCQDGLFYLQSSTLSNSYGPAYIECFYNANKDKTNISGYTSSNPYAKSNDFGFEIYARGGEAPCNHNWVKGETVAPTCTEEGYTIYTCSECNATKQADKVAALGHIDEDEDGICDRCDAIMGGDFVLSYSIKDGDQVVIYNPGHGMAITNANDNNWYLVPEAITPVNNTIADPADYLIWTVVDNKDGTFSFVNGDNAIVAWLSGTYIELTNDANYAGADGNWKVSWTNGLAYIQSSTLSNSYGPAYIECYYNANKDKTNISGYTSSDPTAKSNDFGFQFYVLGADPDVPPVPPVGDLPIADGDLIVIYNAANNVIIGYDEDTDMDEDTYEYTYWNITTEAATVIGKALTADYMNAGTFYAIDNGDGTFAFLDQYDYDVSEGEEAYCITAEAPDTYYGGYDEYACFELIAVDGGYLLYNVADDSYYAIEDGLVVAKDYVEGDKNFVFQFASVDDVEEISDTEANILCTLLEGGSPIVPPTPIGDFVLSEELKDGDQVVIYNPGHGLAITNANDNNWYLVPEAITPANDTITDPDGKFIWTVVDNGDGTLSFVNGSNAIVAWLSGTYIELTNDANYAGADGNWIVSWTDGLAYIQHSTLSNSYGPAYIECYYNANKDKTNISGYTSGDPTAKSNDFGFQFYVLGGDAPCAHEWAETAKTEATCTAAGSITYTCSLCGKTKTEAIAALGHSFGDDNVCDVCGYTKPDIAGDYVLTDSIKDGDQVVIYNPGHGMAISNENDNNWYLVPVAITPEDDAISDPAENLIWTVVDNGDGTFSFVNGDNAIVAWLSGTYIELTNDADYAGADGKWIVSFSGDYAYIQSSSLSNSYGPAYIECYYNANKDKTNISGYTSGDPTAKPNDFGFQFYAIGGTVCEHEWAETGKVAATCTEDGSITYTCSLCGKTKTETVEALGHDFDEDGTCTVCGYSKPSGDGFVKVTDASDLGDGLYLIVYETDSIAMNGGLAKVDAAHNNISVEINDYVIAADDTTMAAAFEIKAISGGYSIQAMGGSFISGDASKNTIKEGTSAVANTITIDDAGNAVIFAGGYLMFNKTSGDTNYRFRYYKAQTQQPIQLYKLAD